MLILGTGKEHFPSVAFEVVVGRNGKAFHVSNAFAGSVNDIIISRNDPEIVEFRARNRFDFVRFTTMSESKVKHI